MSTDDKIKWDKKYAEGAFEQRTHPSALLSDWMPRLLVDFNRNADNRPLRALDIACGAGRNAIYLAENGFSVDAVDISAVGIERATETARSAGLAINWIVHDLDAGLPPQCGSYHLIIMMRYVNIPMVKTLVQMLEPGGIFVCEEHLQSSEAVIGPKNPNFRVAPGALAAAVEDLENLHQFEGIVVDPDGSRAAVSRIIARRKS